MSVLTSVGWVVVQSWWLSTLIAGGAAIALAVAGDRRAGVRYVTALTALVLMLFAPIAFQLSGGDVFGSDIARRPLTEAVASAVSLPRLMDWRPVIVRIAGGWWAVWFCFSALRVVGEWRRAVRLAAGGLRDVTGDIVDAVASLKRDMGVGHDVAVHQSIRAGVPMVFGWPASIILLPSSALSSLNRAELRSILRHELAHVSRRDYAINLLQIFVETLLCHHPAAAWLSQRARIDREYCCDDIAGQDDPAVYAHALARLDDGRGDNRWVVAAASGTLVDRIGRLAGRPRREVPVVQAVAAFVVAAAVAGTVVAFAMALPPQLPPGTRLRSRGPIPADMIPSGPSLPRKQRSR